MRSFAAGILISPGAVFIPTAARPREVVRHDTSEITTYVQIYSLQNLQLSDVYTLGSFLHKLNTARVESVLH